MNGSRGRARLIGGSPCRLVGLLALAAALLLSSAPAAGAAQPIAAALPPAASAARSIGTAPSPAFSAAHSRAGTAAPAFDAAYPVVVPVPGVAQQDNLDQARLQALRPEVQWSPVGLLRWQTVPDEQVVSVGDRVRTGAGAAARLTYFDGSVTEVGPETGLLVQRLDRAPDGNLVASLFQSAGETLSHVLPAVSGLVQFDIETPAVVTRVRGTAPRLQVDPQGVTRVANVPDNTGGEVSVQGKDPAGTIVTLRPGEETTIAPGLPPAAPRPLADACSKGFLGEYFDNSDLRGAPVLLRCDPLIFFDWGRGAPAPSVPAENFSVRWTGRLTLPRDGSYTFAVRVDDGVRLYVDGALLIDEWHVTQAGAYAASRALTAGPHQVVVEYFQAAGEANVRVDWPVPPD